MTQMLLKNPDRGEINDIKGFIIKRSKQRLKSLLLEAIESSRFDRVFNFGYGGR